MFSKASSSQAKAHMSVLILSKELSILVRVFLMRSDVNLADGFWYQHSFMSLAKELKVWKIRWNKSISVIIKIAVSLCVWENQFEHYSPGLRTICLGYWASADPHTPPSSCPRSWDHWEPRHETVAYSLQRCLHGGENASQKKETHCGFAGVSSVFLVIN